jgi:protein-tyrosine phosphatase
MPTAPAETGDPTPLILVVCTGNICRSPAAERLLAAGLGPDSGVRVASAGTNAVAGAPVHPPMATLVQAAGATCDGFAARQLTPALVREAALVVTMTRRHRGAVVELVPAAVRRTFTLRELARLATSVDPAGLPATGPADRLRALVPLAVAQRGRVSAAPEDDDVADPYGLDDAAYAASFSQLRPAVDTLARVLRG